MIGLRYSLFSLALALVGAPCAQAELVVRQNMDPLAAAKLARAMAKSRVAAALDGVDGSGTGGTTTDGSTVINQTVTPSTPGAPGSCVTNIGVTPTTTSTFRYGPGGTADAASRTILVRGDIFNICR